MPASRPPSERQESILDYLQSAIARLLMKNETMRFELFVIREKIARIDRALFSADARELRGQTPPHLLSLFRDLCGPEGICDKSGKTPGRGGKSSQTA
jgi:hypothetical protein